MQGSLALSRDLLYVGRHARTARVCAYDLDGRLLLPGFTFRDARLGRSQVSGLDVDEEGRLWVADTPASRVRVFSAFGQEVGGLGLPLDREPARFEHDDVPGLVRHPVDVVVRGHADELEVVVGCGGSRRHAVAVFDEHGLLRASLRPLGDPRGRFQGVRRVARGGRMLYVAERDAGRVQVFRDGEFHFAFRPGADGRRLEPVAVAPLSDGRLVVACGGEAGALLVCDASGATRRVLAGSGAEEGGVFEPEDVVVDEGGSDAATRVVLLDHDGERVQVFTLAGRFYGAFGELLETVARPRKKGGR